MRAPSSFSRTSAVLGGWALLLLSAACQPAAGDACQTQRFSCAGQDLALECREGSWTEIPCRGAAGCQVEEGRVQCDMSLNQPGDLCPLSAEGQATCKTPELDAVLECWDGVLITTYSCSDCFGSGETLTCLP